jgi:DNA-binding transcriptional regulator YiaG
MFRTIERYEDHSLGLPYPVILINSAEEEINAVTGERVGISIPHMEDMIATVAVARILFPVRLKGSEVKFIRRVLGKSSKEFAASLEIATETYSRWENDKQGVGEWADKQVRLSALVLLRDKAASLEIDGNAVVGMRIRSQSPNEKISIALRLSQHSRLGSEDGADEWKMAA